MRWIVILFLITLGLESCRSARTPLYNQGQFLIDTLPSPPEVPLLFTAFGIGDAGERETAQPVLSLLKEQLLLVSPQRSAVFYLGDNIYPNGLPDSHATTFTNALATLNQQHSATDDYNGQVWWIPGNHDWGNSKTRKQVDRQAQWVADISAKNRRWYPRPEQPFWHLTIVANEVLVVVLDSECWLRAEEPEAFRQMLHLIDTIEVYKDFPKMLLTHHPAYSDGPHGGRFGVKQHLFPLTDVVDWAYVPLPVVGSLYPLFRGTIGHPQDMTHQRYWNLKHLFNGLLSQYPDWIVLSGHEHALQYIQEGDDHYLIAGSGSKTSSIYPRDHSVFAYSQYGLVQITYYADKSVWATFWVPDVYETRGKMIFRKRLY